MTNPDGKTESYTTDENGEILVEKIPVGDYTSVIKEVPDGYTVTTDLKIVTTVKPNDTAEVEFKITIDKTNPTTEAPKKDQNVKTSDNSHLLFATILMLLSVAGAGLVTSAQDILDNLNWEIINNEKEENISEATESFEDEEKIPEDTIQIFPTPLPEPVSRNLTGTPIKTAGQLYSFFVNQNICDIHHLLGDHVDSARILHEFIQVEGSVPDETDIRRRARGSGPADESARHHCKGTLVHAMRANHVAGVDAVFEEEFAGGFITADEAAQIAPSVPLDIRARERKAAPVGAMREVNVALAAFKVIEETRRAAVSRGDIKRRAVLAVSQAQDRVLIPGVGSNISRNTRIYI